MGQPSDQEFSSVTRPPQADHSREHPDPQADLYANPLLLDRHRIVHSMAFRRLQYKTQVFLPFEGDHFRTRMTHSLEVAQMGMVLACRFGAEPQLAELVCLAHDLGHGPFGHAGERGLSTALGAFGGFEHNAQSLRVVRSLERPYPWFAGLNLTRAVLSGIEGHNGPYDRPEAQAGGSLVAQAADWADRIAYDAGDLEDAIGTELIEAGQLPELRLWRQAVERVEPALRDRPIYVIRRLVVENIQRIVIEDLHAEERPDGTVLRLGETTAAALAELERFVADKIYRHPSIAQTDAACQRIVIRLFEKYRSEPDLLPRRYHRRRDECELERIIGDYISGMTDRFCLKVYRQMFGEDDILLSSLNVLIGPRAE